MYRFKEESLLGQFLKLDGAHCAEYLLRILQAVVSVRCTHDPTDSTTIRCSANVAEALGRSSFHVNDLSALLMSHLIKLPEPVTELPSGVIVPTKGAGVYISNTDLFTLKDSFHKLLKRTPGTDQEKKYYRFQEALDLTYDYLKASPLFADPRNPKVSLLGDDPMATVLGARSIHRCQVPRLVQAQLQGTSYKVPRLAQAQLQGTSYKAGALPPVLPLPQPFQALQAIVTQEEAHPTRPPTPPPSPPTHPPPPPEPTSSSARAAKPIRLGVKRKAIHKATGTAPRSSSPEDFGQGGGQDTDPECC
jgi:hypothetical protein